MKKSEQRTLENVLAALYLYNRKKQDGDLNWTECSYLTIQGSPVRKKFEYHWFPSTDTLALFMPSETEFGFILETFMLNFKYNEGTWEVNEDGNKISKA